MSLSATQPYNRAVVITKSDTVNYDGSTYSASAAAKAIPADAILVGDTGIVIAIMEDGTAVRLTAGNGAIIPLKTIRVNSTTTSATNLYALYFV